MIRRLMQLLYPPKCILCQTLLDKKETDLCHKCRTTLEDYIPPKKNISFVASWQAMWYYKDNVRDSILRYKFNGRISYGPVYARFLALRLMQWEMTDFDLITWVPISAKRRRKRGFDQVKILCVHTARELGRKATATLKKHRHTPAQSSLPHPSQRRANVLGAYRVIDPKTVVGKRILLLDDVITTGSTVSECARVLLTAGAKEVYCAAIAATSYTKR